MFGLKSLKKSKKNIISFDIFDTLITRRVAIPRGIFAVMQEQLSNSDLPEKLKLYFYSSRIECEAQARKIKHEISNTTEVNFDDIYAYIKQEYGLTYKQTDYLKKLETDTELQNIVPLNENIDILKKYISNGYRVILISDMYHTSDTLRSFLISIDEVFKDIPIYVSSEYGKNKHTGNIYPVIKEIEDIDYKNWIHYGDNKIADIKNAKEFGIKTKLCPIPPLMPYENEALQKCPINTKWQISIGISRLCRRNKQKKHQETYNLGASLTAPILYGYVDYLIKDALDKNIKTLYFVSRDGYIPKIIADVIIKHNGLDLKTKYLYGSRLTWRILDEDNYEKLITKIMNEYPKKMSIAFMAERLHIDIKMLNKFFNVKNTEKVLTNDERIVITNKMLSSPEIKNTLINAGTKNREMLLKYIKQEINLSEQNICLVDILGTGVTNSIFCNYINSICNKNFYCYYYCMPYQYENDNIICYTFYDKICANAIIETLTRANHGQVLSYRFNESNNLISPNMENGYFKYVKKWGFEEYIKGIKDYTNAILNSNLELFDEYYSLSYKYYDYIEQQFIDKETKDILNKLPYKFIGMECNAKNELLQESYDIIKILKSIINKFYLYNQNTITEIKLLYILNRFKNRKIILWGASLFLESFIKKFHINYKNIIGIVDRNPTIYSKKIGIYNIFSPDEIKKQNPDCIISTIKNNNYFNYLQVKSFLKQEKIKAKLIPDVFRTHYKNDINVFNKYQKILQQRTKNVVIDNKRNIICSEVYKNLPYAFPDKDFYDLRHIYKFNKIFDAALSHGGHTRDEVLNVYDLAYNLNIPLFAIESGFISDINGMSSFIIDNVQYFDATQPSEMEDLIQNKNLVLTEEQIQRAKICIEKIISNYVTKYNHQPIYTPKIGREGVSKILVVDQSYNDLSITKGLANDKTFDIMLQSAIKENPNSDIIVKIHPDSLNGFRNGYYQNIKEQENVYLFAKGINPISMINYCDKVYVCSSQLGFEALMCGKEVHTFGMPFYAGWGLTKDYIKCERRTNKRTLEEIFYIAYIMKTKYVNPEKKCPCEIEEEIDCIIKSRNERFNLTEDKMR